MVIQQGDVYWVDLGEPRGSEPAYRRPVVVIQNNLFNQSNLRTVVVCALTSNQRYATLPGNVALEEGEANLPKASVANVTQLYTLGQEDLAEWCGKLAARRLAQILRGVYGVLQPREVD
ncbi:MAG: type II toxin-antitoxin system PemK/MazF family toxin [Anaerolineae bacterium]|nr:MAG: type II toxin-antitoxin system PemK/MazF family toxin [Anaerolineae bacterium]